MKHQPHDVVTTLGGYYLGYLDRTDQQTQTRKLIDLDPRDLQEVVLLLLHEETESRGWGRWPWLLPEVISESYSLSSIGPHVLSKSSTLSCSWVKQSHDGRVQFLINEVVINSKLTLPPETHDNNDDDDNEGFGNSI